MKVEISGRHLGCCLLFSLRFVCACKYKPSFLFFFLASLDTKVVGPFLAAPAKPLQEELEEFMQKSGNEGVILVSFGTIMGNINENMLTLLANAFSRVSQKIIWKLDRGRLSAFI